MLNEVAGTTTAGRMGTVAVPVMAEPFEDVPETVSTKLVEVSVAETSATTERPSAAGTKVTKGSLEDQVGTEPAMMELPTGSGVAVKVPLPPIGTPVIAMLGSP